MAVNRIKAITIEIGGDIIILQITLKSVNNEIRKTQVQLRDVGGNIKSVGKRILLVAAIVTALGTASVKTAADFEVATSKVATVSGVVSSDLMVLTKKTREMGIKTEFSAAVATETMNYMAVVG